MVFGHEINFPACCFSNFLCDLLKSCKCGKPGMVCRKCIGGFIENIDITFVVEIRPAYTSKKCIKPEAFFFILLIEPMQIVKKYFLIHNKNYSALKWYDYAYFRIKDTA